MAILSPERGMASLVRLFDAVGRHFEAIE